MSDVPVYRVRSDVRFRVVQGEAVVLRQSEAELLVLNEVGSRILSLVADGAPTGTIVATLADEYEADGEELAADVERFLAELVEAAVIELAAEDGELGPQPV